MTETAHRAIQGRSIDTRLRILDAAVSALVSFGYSGATTLRIQELAEVSRGRLLHHYPSRDDLLVAAVAHVTEAQINDLIQDVEWPSDPSLRISDIVDRMWTTFQQPYFWASTELWLAARSNTRLRDALQPYERRVGATIARRVDTFFGRELSARVNYPVARELLVTSMRGVSLTYAFRPEDPISEPSLQRWKQAINILLLEPDQTDRTEQHTTEQGFPFGQTQ